LLTLIPKLGNHHFSIASVCLSNTEGLQNINVTSTFKFISFFFLLYFTLYITFLCIICFFHCVLLNYISYIYVFLLCHRILVWCFVLAQIPTVANMQLNLLPSKHKHTHTHTHTHDRFVTNRHRHVIQIVKSSKLLGGSLICINIVIKSPHKVVQ
jgi:hypothetical protein